MSRNPLRNVRRTHKVFFEHYGTGPWQCKVCGGVVTCLGLGTWDGNVHHLDEDVTNDTPENLAIMHVICHQHEHPITDELKLRISTKLKGRPSPTKGMRFSAEVNARKSRPGTSNPFYGHIHTEAAKRKMRGPRRRSLCVDCGRSYAVSWLRRHKIEGRCT